MSALFPRSPFIPAAGREKIVCEHVLPAPSQPHRALYKVCKALPAGRPDWLDVSIMRSPAGTERCTAAYYNGRAYLIHYDFKRS